MGFVGLVPSEYSSGGSTHRGHMTKAGNAHVRAQLVEAAWAYQHRPYVGPEIAKRQDGSAPRGGGPGVVGPAASVRPVPSSRGPQEHQVGGGRGGGP